MARAHRAAVLAGALAALIPARAAAGDGFHPFRDFGKDTAAPPGQAGSSGGTSGTTVVSAPGMLSVTTVSPGDPGSAIGRADPHPYHPFRDFGLTPAPAPAPAGAAPIAAPNWSGGSGGSGGSSSASQSDPFAGEKEPWPDVKPWDKKDEKEQREDAAANFENVITTYLAREGTPQGCWLYREKSKTMCLKLLAVDGAHAKKVAPGRYAAVAAMADVRSKARPALRFTVDFSSEEWDVVDIQRLKK